MRKIIVGMLVGLVFCLASVAMALNNAASVEASSAYKAASTLIKSDHNGGIEALKKLIADYPSEPSWLLAGAESLIGQCKLSTNDNAGAQAIFEKALVDYPTADTKTISSIQSLLLFCLQKQQKLTEASVLAVDFVQKYAWELGAKDENSMIWKAFDMVNPKLMSATDYKAFLEKTIQATRATDDNAKFLGRVKSEIEKMK